MMMFLTLHLCAWALHFMYAEESLNSESTFCSARYYKPLVHKSGYGNQVILKQDAHLWNETCAKLLVPLDDDIVE